MAMPQRARPGNRNAVATHRLRRTADGTPILDIELARRGLQLKDIIARGAPRQMLQRLRIGDASGYGQQTKLLNAYKIARAIDEANADALVDTLFERINAASN